MRMKVQLNQKGQTSIEYLLLIVVGALLGILVFNKLSGYFLKDPNSYVNKQLAPLKDFSDKGGRFKKFPLRLPK
jgi:hypothetical protein